MSVPQFHFIVIGAGPAGSSAAWGLARDGWRVAILERAAFPRVKVCGEFISPAATELLEAIVPAAELIQAGAKRVDEFVLQAARRQRVWKMPRPAWAFSRASLDLLLLEKATQAGAVVRQSEGVQSVAYADDAVALTLRGGATMRTACVIHADGAGRHDPSGATPLAPDMIGYKCHLRVPPGTGDEIALGLKVRGVTMRACPGAYVGMIAVENGLVTCALTVTKKVASQHKGDGDAMLTALWPQYDPAWRSTPWLACGVARSGYIRPGHGRSLRIGNAAAAVDPIGGEGIGLALWAGTRLVECLRRTLEDGNRNALQIENIIRAERAFASEYATRLRWRRPACRLAAEVFIRPALVRALWPLLGWPRMSIAPWYKMTGKPT